MKHFTESTLKEEMADIIEFIERIIPSADRQANSVIITPQTYSRHMAAMYLTIECMKSEVFLESKITGDYRAWNRLSCFLKGLGL